MIDPGQIPRDRSSSDLGQQIQDAPGVDKISFTGGIVAARAVLAGAAHHLTPAVLELGGKSGNLVFPDADLDAAGAERTAAALDELRPGSAMGVGADVGSEAGNVALIEAAGRIIANERLEELSAT